jgi:hypothetical protein
MAFSCYLPQFNGGRLICARDYTTTGLHGETAGPSSYDMPDANFMDETTLYLIRIKKIDLYKW